MIPHERGRVETLSSCDHARRDLALALGLYGRESVSLCNMLLRGMSQYEQRYVLGNLAELVRETSPHHRSAAELLAELAAGSLRELIQFREGLDAAAPWIILAFIELEEVLPDAPGSLVHAVNDACRALLRGAGESLAEIAGEWSEELEARIRGRLERQHA